jgi:hypothetical protein
MADIVIGRTKGEGLEVAPDTGIEGTATRVDESPESKGLKRRRAAQMQDEEMGIGTPQEVTDIKR